MAFSWQQRAAAALAAATLVAGAVPVSASAHTMPASTAMAVAKQAAAKIKRQTHASSARVLKCTRKSQHRFLCKGEARYTTGASRCTFDITVRYTSTTRRTTKYDISKYLCY